MAHQTVIRQVAVHAATGPTHTATQMTAPMATTGGIIGTESRESSPLWRAMDAKEAAPLAAAPSHHERVAHGNSGFFKPRNVLNDIPFRGSRVFERGGGERGKDHARPDHNNSADYVVPEKGDPGKK